MYIFLGFFCTCTYIGVTKNVSYIDFWPGRSSFISWELKSVEYSIYLCLTGELLWVMTPQKANLDSLRTLSWFVSFIGLSSQFQFSLSAVTLEYLSHWVWLCTKTTILYGGPQLYNVHLSSPLLLSKESSRLPGRDSNSGPIPYIRKAR